MEMVLIVLLELSACSGTSTGGWVNERAVDEC